MQRRTLLAGVATVAALGLVLTGCSSSTDGGGDANNSGMNPDGATVISFAASMLGETQRGPLLGQMITDFNESQSEVIVTPVTIPFSSFGSTMFTQVGGGEGPDIIAWDEADFFQAMDQGLTLPIDEIVDEDAMLASSKNEIMDGARYGVPLNVSNYALIYNPDLVTNVPTTFDELVAEAKAQTKDGVYGFAFRHTEAEEAGVWSDVSNYVFGFGGDWAKDGKPTLTSQGVIDGVTAMKELYDAGVIPEGATAAEYRKMFAEGKVAMIIDNGGVPTVINGTNPATPIAAALAPFPTEFIGEISAVLAVNANTKKADAAKAFLEWFLQPEQQATVQGLLGGSQAATTVPRTEEELATRPYVEIFDQVAPNTKAFAPQGMEAVTPQFRHIVVEQLLRIFQGQVSVEDGMAAAQKEAEGLS
jgi:multiple sugar transport system substrate-binding protein